MPDHCPDHYTCIDSLKKELHDGFAELKDMLRDGSIVHAKLQLEIGRLDAELRSLKEANAKIDWQGALFKLGMGLLEKGVIVIFGMAAWAAMNGYGK